MPVRPIKPCIITYFVCVVLLFFLETDPFFSFTSIRSSGNAAAAPISSSNRRARTAVREGVNAQREIELVRTTSQGVTIQLLIPESDFEIGTEVDSSDQLQVSRVETQTVSFPGCRFAVVSPGALRLPVQSTLISVPVDADFQVRIVEQDFSTRKIAVRSSVSRRFPTTLKPPVFFLPILWRREKRAGSGRTVCFRFNSTQFNTILCVGSCGSITGLSLKFVLSGPVKRC